MRIRALLLSLLLLPAAGQQVRPADDDPEPNYKNLLRGEWQLTYRCASGVVSDDDLVKNRTITFDDKTYTIRDRKQVTVQLSYTLDTSKRPVWIDVKFVQPDTGGTD